MGHSVTRRWWDASIVLGWLLLETGILAVPYLIDVTDRVDNLTRNTVRLALVYYAAAAILMLLLRPAEWTAEHGRGRLARWLWTAAWASYVIHIVVAIELYHHGSHAEAMAHVEAVSGWGEGIYVSHLFGLLWTLDVTWWWLWPSGYASRSPWVDRILHGFMAFMIFNGTVVYETGVTRLAGVVLFMVLIAVWWVSLTGRRRTATA